MQLIGEIKKSIFFSIPLKNDVLFILDTDGDVDSGDNVDDGKI